MIYIDQLKSYPNKHLKFAHMTADSLEELHEYADLIGLDRKWFHNVRHPHYDIDEHRYKDAIVGAKLVDSRELMRKAKLLYGT